MSSIKSSCQYTQYIDSPPRCMPYRIINKKSPLKSQNIKDIDVTFFDHQNIPNQYQTTKIFSSVDAEEEIPIRIDKRTIKDAVLVRQINLEKKQLLEGKKNYQSMAYSNRRSLINIKKAESVKENHKNSHKIPSKISASKRDSQQLKFDQFLKKQENNDNFSIMTTVQSRSLGSFCKSDIFCNNKLANYLKLVREIRQFHNLNHKLQQTPKKKALTVTIKRGNNSALIKQMIKKRWWLTIEEQKERRSNFVWSQLKEKDYFVGEYETREEELYFHNHFPHNEYIGNKKALFYNMNIYYESQGKNVFEYLPLTFHVQSLKDENWKKFKKAFEERESKGQKNVWIIKPGENSNRGKGITIHEKLQEIQKILSFRTPSFDNFSRTFIIQSYIDRPFLYNRRKFDIRAYMLLVRINKLVKGYWYREGYIRTSSHQFQLNDFNTYIHLTNDAIQNSSDTYGKYEDGNKISYAHFQKYLEKKYGGQLNFRRDAIPLMKEIALDAIKASIKWVKGYGNLNHAVFEIYGLDYMIDENFKPWLIEINTNPCIETSSILMEKIIPRMVDEAFRLSLDIIFPPPEMWPNSKKHNISSLQQGFELFYDEKEELNQNSLPSTSNSHQTLGMITEDDETFEEK